MTAIRGIVKTEVRRQLTSAAVWLCVALFALMAGGAFVTTLNAASSLRPWNVNQLAIRPFLLQIGAAVLLVLPLMTAPVYTEWRRSESAERWQRSRGKNAHTAVAMFVAMLAMYAILLLIPFGLVALLFAFGRPEWGSIATGYLGLLLVGAAFISTALVISSMAGTASAAAAATFAISAMVAGATWLARSGTAGAQRVFRYVSVGDGLDDFAKGVLDTGHIVFCMTVIVLGLFVTTQVLDMRQAPE
jgi:ABC-2 type transport system permease protein